MGLFERLAPANLSARRTLGAGFVAYLQLFGEGEMTRAELVEIFQMDASDEVDLDAIVAALPNNAAGRVVWWKHWDMALNALDRLAWRADLQALAFVADTSVHSFELVGKLIQAGPAPDQTTLADQFIAEVVANRPWDHTTIQPYAVRAGAELHVFNTGNNLVPVASMQLNAHERVRQFGRARARAFLGL